MKKAEKDYSYILFDLDGTLTDSGPGIVNGFEYAVKKMGGKVENKEMFKKLVGPPLRDSFGVTLGYGPENTDKAISFYREYYNERGGILENSVYSGVEQMLENLKKSGKKLIVATSKNEQGTEIVLEHFGLKKYFDFVASSNDTDRLTKTKVIQYAIDQCGISDIRKAVMVGDRNNDILAAADIGMDSIGVLYGYGDEEELLQAGATYLAKTPNDVEKYILS